MDDKDLKRIILIGRSGSGKTSLCQAIRGEDLKYYKTQTVHIENMSIIDTPGEYIERAFFKSTLTAAAVDAEIVVLFQDPTREQIIFPPLYTTMFNKPSIGLVTKTDIASKKSIENAEHFLRLAGVETVLRVSNKTKEGIKELLELIKK